MDLTYNVVSFTGRNWDLADRLRGDFATRGYDLRIAGTPQQFVKNLQETRECKQRLALGSELLWVSEYFTPVVLEIDCAERASMEFVREIKRLHGAIPIVVIGSNVDLASLSVARLDGADAMFEKTRLDLAELAEAISDALARVRRWHELIADLGKSVPLSGFSHLAL